MSESITLVVDVKKEIKNAGNEYEKAVFSSLEKIKNSSSEEYIGSATFSLVVDSLTKGTSIFKISY